MPTDKNLARLAEAAFERRGDYESLLFEDRWHRSAELFSRAARIAGGFAALGVAPGERVVVTMANRPEVSVVYQALWRAGAVVTPATFLLPAEDLRHVIVDSGACGVITTSEFVDKVREAVAGLPEVRFVVISTDGAHDGEDDGEIALDALEQSDPLPIVERDDDDLAALLWGGGQGEGVVSLNAPGDGVSPDELVAWARERIGGYKYPREVHIVDSVPLTAVGKLDRKALRGRLL